MPVCGAQLQDMGSALFVEHACAVVESWGMTPLWNSNSSDMCICSPGHTAVSDARHKPAHAGAGGRSLEALKEYMERAVLELTQETTA